MAPPLGLGGASPGQTGGCEETYGIFPCSESLFGSIILMGMYGNLLLVGANLIGDGSELLLEIMDPGLIGGLVLPILGALPDAAMIVVSGMGGTVQAAQEQVAVGVGTLAGSTVMLLSIAWGGSLILGRCDIVQGRAKDKTLTKGWQPGARLTLRWLEATLTQTGVSTDKATRINAYIMIATGLLYFIPQIPTFSGFEHDPMAALGGAIACGLALAAYCAYQVVAPELQKRKMEHARKQLAVRSTLRMAHGIAATAGSVLVDERGVIRDVALQAVFVRFDEDKSGTIDRQELRKMAKVFLASSSSASMSAAHMESNIEEFMRGMDADGDGQITFEEMKQGLQRWLHDLKMEQDAAKQRRGGGGRASDDESLLLLDDQQHLIAAAGFVDEDDDDDEQESEAEGAMTPEEITRTAAFKLLAGAAIVAFVADPMVDAVAAFSSASNIPAFFVSFVVTPFASNASELVSSLGFAKAKKIKNISLTFCQVYGAVAMNNTMCLGLFLLVVYARGLAWDFSAEVVTTMSSILALGLIAISGETFTLFWGLVSLVLYPLALGLVAYLDYGLGWH